MLSVYVWNLISASLCVCARAHARVRMCVWGILFLYRSRSPVKGHPEVKPSTSLFLMFFGEHHTDLEQLRQEDEPFSGVAGQGGLGCERGKDTRGNMQNMLRGV